MTVPWSTVSLDSEKIKRYEEQFSTPVFGGSKETALEDHPLLCIRVPIGASSVAAEGYVAGEDSTSGRPLLVAELLYIEGEHEIQLPKILLLECENPDSGELVTRKQEETYATGPGDLESWRRQIVTDRFRHLQTTLGRETAMVDSTRRLAGSDDSPLVAQARDKVARTQRLINEITKWHDETGRDYGLST